MVTNACHPSRPAFALGRKYATLFLAQSSIIGQVVKLFGKDIDWDLCRPPDRCWKINTCVDSLAAKYIALPWNSHPSC
jgi:hypothetical protein